MRVWLINAQPTLQARGNGAGCHSRGARTASHCSAAKGAASAKTTTTASATPRCIIIVNKGAAAAATTITIIQRAAAAATSTSIRKRTAKRPRSWCTSAGPATAAARPALQARRQDKRILLGQVRFCFERAATSISVRPTGCQIGALWARFGPQCSLTRPCWHPPSSWSTTFAH